MATAWKPEKFEVRVGRESFQPFKVIKAMSQMPVTCNFKNNEVIGWVKSFEKVNEDVWLITGDAMPGIMKAAHYTSFQMRDNNGVGEVLSMGLF